MIIDMENSHFGINKKIMIMIKCVLFRFQLRNGNVLLVTPNHAGNFLYRPYPPSSRSRQLMKEEGGGGRQSLIKILTPNTFD